MKSTYIVRPDNLSQILSVVVVLASLSFSSRSFATETVIHSFSGSDGSQPTAGLTPDGAGNYYGTTFGGGIFGFGTVFELSSSAGGGWTETVLYNFTGFSEATRRGAHQRAGRGSMVWRASSSNICATIRDAARCLVAP